MKRILALITLVMSCSKLINNIEITNKDINHDLVSSIIKDQKDVAIELIRRGANVNYFYNGGPRISFK